MDEKKTYGALTVHRERAYYLKRLEQFEHAKASHDEAYSYAPGDVRNLIGRSQVCADAVQPEQAYKDAELALKLEPNNMCARNVQARALFTMAEYEKSLIMNYRGVRVRRKPSYFMEGINQGTETIQDCIGKNAGNVMQKFLPLIKHQEALLVENAVSIKSQHKCRIPQKENVVILSQMEARKHSTLSRVLAMKYLGPMAYDKFFLENLMVDRRLKSANVKGYTKIEALVKQAFKTLNDRQEMLRSQRPYYTIKLAEKSESKYQNMYKKVILVQDCMVSTRIADQHCRQIEECLTGSRVMELISKAERFQKYLDSKTTKTLPDKDMYISRLYRVVGEAYLTLHRVSYTQSEKSSRRRIRFLMGLPISRATSYDSVTRHYPRKYGDLNLITKKAMRVLDMCENAFMKCWVLHDLARLFILQKNYMQSKFYAKQCQREAQDIGSVTWWLNGCFVLLSGEMQLGNLQEVRAHVEKAYEWSKNMQDSEQVQTFLSECVRIASETVSADERKVVEQREKQILSIMDEDQRVEARYLLKRISLLPQGRRFPVLPRKTFLDILKDDKSERRERKQIGISIIPGIEKGIPVDPKTDVRGYQIFDM